MPFTHVNYVFQVDITFQTKLCFVFKMFDLKNCLYLH